VLQSFPNNFSCYIDDAENVADIQQGENLGSLMEENQSGKYVTAREYYCFLMQVRRGLFNILLFGGRLFQQWAVDMYIKIESMRLDWYANPANQKLIRAELYQVRQMFSQRFYLENDHTAEDISEHYRWISGRKVWQRRKK